MRKRIAIFTMHEVSNTYYCLHYLKQALSNDFEVHMYGFSKTEEIDEKYMENYHSLTEAWYGQIRRVRVYLSKIKMLFLANKYDAFIINDLDFFRIGYWIKKRYPQKKIIHYNTEIHDVDIKYPWHTTSFYKKHASYPDLIIECLDKRAEYRKKTFKINKDIYVINNTVPEAYIEKILALDIDVSKYFTFDNPSLPVLIYAGGCNLSRGLGDIINVVPRYEGKLNFLFFCHGSVEDYTKVESMCKLHKNVKIYKAVRKEILFNVMNKCNIGIQYYDPTVSVNHLYASPSKFFEYMALGLNIVSSRNKGIDAIIEENKCGVCFETTETLGDGIDKLMKQGLNLKENIQALFREYYCYEKNSNKTISQLIKLIGE